VANKIHDHLLQTADNLEAVQARERQQDYEKGTLRALCLVNTVADLPDLLPQGKEICEATLGLYKVLDREDWENDPAWQRLVPEERLRLAENTRELLLLLAWARLQTG